MSILGKLASEITTKATTKATAKATAKAVAREAAAETGKKAAQTAAQTLGRDVLKKTAAETTKKAAETAANPAFDAAMAAVRERLASAGKYSNVSTPLLEAISKASTTEEALQVASLARKLSVGYNQANRGALVEALGTAASKAKVHEEAFAVLKQTVQTREEAYAIFRVSEKRKLVETVVEKYMKVGGLPTEELATKAIKLVDPVFNQSTAKSTVKRVALMETLAEQVRTIANFINKALR